MNLYYFLSTNLDSIPPVLILNAPFIITFGPFAYLIPQKHLPLKRNYANEPNQSETRGWQVLNKFTSTISWFLHKQIFRQFETG
jgi:hypothetical protein